MNKKAYLFLLFIIAGGMNIARAQHYTIYPVQYRPPGQHWQQLRTRHFRIIFPRGQDSIAYKTAHILENQYSELQKLTGGHLTNFPVILNGYSDRSNGFVTPFNFRSEIIISPGKGKTLNPVNGGWLRNVVPHELTHAFQYNHFGGFGLGSLVRIFSPDLARSIHGAPPSGIQEGLAVYHESHGVVPGGGRGNYPYFTNIFNSIFLSSKRWSMGQMVQSPAFNRPFNRHYIGGYEFTQWLQETYGPKTTRDAIDFHIRWPFLGYGVALKVVTGQWPGQLYDQFVKDKKQELQIKYHRKHYAHYQTLPVAKQGIVIRRPKWLSDSTLVFYGSFYNARPGFYRYDLQNHSIKRVVTTGSVSGYNYTILNDGKTIIYSFYKPDLIYPNAFKATLTSASLVNGGSHQIRTGEHLYNPVFKADSTLYALKAYHATAKLVKVDLASQSVYPLYTNLNYQLISVAAKPTNPDSLAIIMNANGNQALWIVSVNNLKEGLSGSPAISFTDGSIFDPVWRPDGQALLFSADFSGILQVYEYNLKPGSITQVTNAKFNAFEASYSPDGNRIAFVIQRGNEKLPVVIPRSQFYGKSITANTRKVIPKGIEVLSTPKESWTVEPYKTGFSWLKPRTVLPVIKQIDGSDNQYRFGVGLYSSDLLAEQSYVITGSIGQGRFWYDATYRNKQFFPGFKVRVYSKPEFNTFLFKTPKGNQFLKTFLRQKRRFEVGIPMQFTLRQNVSSTSFFVEPKFGLTQIRYFDCNGNHPSNMTNTAFADLFVQFNYRLQQDIRSVQPNSGLILYSEIEQFFGNDKLHLRTRKGVATLRLNRPTAFRAGLFGYVSPLRRWNQSLRIGIETINQTGYVFDNQDIVSNGFSGPVFPLSKNLMSFSSRYTIPIFYPDNGGLLIPLYLGAIYLVAYSDTVVSLDSNAARTVIGAGFHIRFRLSNLTFDVGFGFGYEPSRNKTDFFIGNF